MHVNRLAVACLVWLLGSSSFLHPVAAMVVEIDSTADLIEVVAATQIPTFVTVFKEGCHWCEELEPAFEYLERLFGPKLQLVRVDGRRATRFTETMQIRSFPELLLLQGGAVTLEQMSESHYAGSYQGPRNVKSLAAFISERTGLLAELPDALVKPVNSLPEIANSAAVILFLSPYMDPQYASLFASGAATDVAERLASDNCDLDVAFYSVDVSNQTSAATVNALRIGVTPTAVVVTPKGRYVKYEFRARNGLPGNQARETLQTMLNRCLRHVDDQPSACIEYVNTLPNAFFYDSLQDLQGDAIEQVLDPDLDSPSDFDEEWLFGSLRDL
ncbi:LAMI_0B04434g1_1 [Lachancea mirantina]|uniref:LAMI_0B04434g1_1 n=1 Tax=Lachancea mirantina TaxID=1230905 RepID=A0A1G4IW05_9SACH|nr:LAMI_0B04434g1_1 [Lachancea mirantina]